MNAFADIAIIGTHGLPVKHGGFETFAEHISEEFAKKGKKVLVVGDSSSTTNYNYKPLTKTQSIKVSKKKNPLIFYLYSLCLVYYKGVRIVIMTGVGGALFIPIFSLLGMKIFLNPDGLGYLRTKYSWGERKLFGVLYWLASKLSSNMIFDSDGVKSLFDSKFKFKGQSAVIEYGAKKETVENQNEYLRALMLRHDLDLKRETFHLIVARLEPENNVETIIKGYSMLNRKWPLVIVGPMNTAHYEQLSNYSDRVKFIGGIYDKKELLSLRKNCGAYWHGHSVGGTNPSLLEAMVNGNVCCCHDNIFNRSTLGENDFYWKTQQDVSKIISRLESSFELSEREFVARLNERIIMDRFTWEIIGDKYFHVLFNAKA